jgi:putative spermidine/putrescine transport system ATP-binding protein
VALVIRPERLGLVGAGAPSTSGAPVVSARVTDVRYLGSHNRVGLRFDNGDNGSLMQMVGDSSVPAPGSSVAVTWSPRHQSVVTVGGPVGEPPVDEPAAATTSLAAL